VGAIAAGLVVPVLAFYLLRDFDLTVAAIVGLLHVSARERAVALGREIDAVLGQFVRGQLIVMAILGALYALGFSLLSVRLAIPIGLLAGLLSFIPYVGSATALTLALLMSALHFGGIGQIVGVVAVYAAIQTLEGFVITPRIVGDSLGLSPVWVLIALMVGAELFGFVGVMLALPVSAVLKVLAMHGLRRYRLSSLYGAQLPPVAGLARVPARLRLRPRRGARRTGAVQ
jgi:predicted PurR-regulated permease PerM